MSEYLKGTFVKAVLVDVSQLTKLTVYYSSLQGILPKHSVLSPVLTMCARKVIVILAKLDLASSLYDEADRKNSIWRHISQEHFPSFSVNV